MAGREGRSLKEKEDNRRGPFKKIAPAILSNDIDVKIRSIINSLCGHRSTDLIFNPWLPV
jgi:hypothetical protein